VTAVIATPNHREQLDDALREILIELALHVMAAAPRLSRQAYAAWHCMTALIKGRSAAQVARMEQERGLVRQQ
jgi:hypothetical protein